MSGSIIDTNVHLSRWPFRRLREDEPEALVAKLRAGGVVQAWAGSFDGILHKDIGGVNARLVEDCHHHGDGLLLPFGSVNPKLPDWEEELRRCHEDYKMPGIRLHPNYHGCKLEEPEFARLLRLATERGLLVQLAMSIEDDRTQHPLMRVPAVDILPLIPLVKQTPGLRLMLLNGFRVLKGEPLLRLMAAGNVCFEISTVEVVGGVADLIKQIPVKRVLFGSHAPFYYFESAQLKMKEAALSEAHAKAIFEENARNFLAGTSVPGSK